MNRREFVRLAGAGAAYTGLGGLGGIAAAQARRDPDFEFHSPLSEAWYRSGSYFPWTSTTENNEGRTVQVFHQTWGDRANPPLLLVHGFPNSSFDFHRLVPLLQERYFIAALDFPGFGFSDKPQDGYSYMLEDDARLLDFYVREILGLDRFHLFTHDRGVSVGLAFMGNYLDAPRSPYEITYHFLSNSGMYLPLANLFPSQTAVLDPVRGPEYIAELKARPRLTEGDAEDVAFADIQAFNDGVGVRLHIGKYLLERAANETRWLENLPRSPVPSALLWGLQDPVNPVRIANHVWDTYMNEREVESSFWYLPSASHYPQREAPAEVAEVVELCLAGRVPAPSEETEFMMELMRGRTDRSPVYVGRSRPRPMVFPGAIQYSPRGYPQ